MRKRLLCLALVLCLFAGLALPAPAADEESEMLQILAALGVMNGDQNGNLNLSQPVTRAQFAKMAVAASRTAGGTGSAAPPFSDVDSGHWASGYIAAAAEAGWLNGYPDGRFCPEQTVTLAEAVTVLEKLLGYSDGDFADGWPAPQLALARTLGLTRDVSADGGTPLTRRACARLVCNTLGAQTSSGPTYARTLGIALDADGAIDCDALVASVTRGPMVVEKAGWADALGFTPLHVYRNGAEVSLSAIQVYDVVYVSEKMSSVWAYSKTVTGTLEAVLPNTSSPDRITVSGTT